MSEPLTPAPQAALPAAVPTMPDPAAPLPGETPEPENEVKLTFFDHLTELRKRVTQALLGVVAGMIVVGVFTSEIFDWLMKPVRAALPPGLKLVYIDPIEPFMVYIKVAIYGGIFLAVPWILWQLWQFTAPGLYKKEKKVVFPFIVSGTILFYTGAAFCRFLVMPPAFPAILAIANSETATPMLGMSATLSIVLAMLLGFGVVFEVPVVMAFLAMIGLVSAKSMAKYRRFAIVINVTAAAIITPTGDPINLALMAVPMIVFYEVGIILARILGKKPAADTAIVKV
jgi:sec-independent protein translocase protein TatC